MNEKLEILRIDRCYGVGSTRWRLSIDLDIDSGRLEFASHTTGPRGGHSPAGYFALTPEEFNEVVGRVQDARQLLARKG